MMVKAIKKAINVAQKLEKELVLSVMREIEKTNTGKNQYDLPTEKIKQLETTVQNLANKITILTDKIVMLEKQVVHLSTTNEQLMYVMENGYDGVSLEDDLVNELDDKKEPKFNLN
jgi:predicted RNase H-like nuclease (RuvC/YqgF family)